LSSAGHSSLIEKVCANFQHIELTEKDVDDITQHCLVRGEHEAAAIVLKSFDAKHLQIMNSINFLCAGKEADAALDFLESLSDNIELTSQMFHPIIGIFAKQNRVNDIFSVYELMINKDIPLDNSPKYIQSFLRDRTSNDYNLCLQLIMRDNNILSTSGFATAILKSSDFIVGNVIEAISDLHKRGLDVTVIIEQVIENLSYSREGPKAFQILKGLIEKDIIPVDQTSCSKLLKFMLQAIYQDDDMTDELFMVLHMMKEHGIDPDVHQYFSLLRVAAEIGNATAAQFCFDKVLGSDEYQDAVGAMYTFLMKAYVKDAKTVKDNSSPKHLKNNYRVVHLFNEMMSKGFTPSDFIVESVLETYLLNLDIEGAMEVMKEHGKDPAVFKCVGFLRAYINRKEFTNAEKLFERMKSKSSVSTLAYNEIMQLCLRRGNKKVEELYHEMLAEGLEPSRTTHMLRIESHMKLNQPELCLDILRDNSFHLGFYKKLLEDFAPTGDMKTVVTIIKLMKEEHEGKVPQKYLGDILNHCKMKSVKHLQMQMK